ncbi:hypothetical protein L2089_15795 [Paenibacillus hunanensis]|uniref:hypothetical protein n=1 Tax=Paenibacillus hunanensis TaxID=539262 RepID=UPI002026ED0F|nr:hypothetical protein [Paenibacillus hunanensis]MCL9662157.1 hypothetical protein [Paenibacillus hunanensis]
MNSLEKAVRNKGISYQHTFQYQIRDQEVVWTVGHILFTLNQSKQLTKDNLKSHTSMVKQGTAELALTFLQGLGQTLAAEAILGEEEAKKYREVIEALSIIDTPQQVDVEVAGERKRYSIVRTKSRPNYFQVLLPDEEEFDIHYSSFPAYIYQWHIVDVDVDEARFAALQGM